MLYYLYLINRFVTLWRFWHFPQIICNGWVSELIFFKNGSMLLNKHGCNFWFFRVSDSDGNFLLIEAAEELPKWLEPNASENRVRIVLFSCITSLDKKFNFALRIFSVNMTKSAGVHLFTFTEEILKRKLYFLCCDRTYFKKPFLVFILSNPNKSFAMRLKGKAGLCTLKILRLH